MFRMWSSTQYSPTRSPATSPRRASMWARSSAGGWVPCRRHTTMGVSQMSHSAIQQTSSSWYQGVILLARQRSQLATVPSGGGSDGADAMASHMDHGGDGEQHEGRRHHEDG